MAFLFDRETPSCFSNRVSKVRRTNVTEKVKLQRQIESLEVEQSIRHFQLHKEKQNLIKELSKMKETKELDSMGLQRRRRLPLLQQVDRQDRFQSASTYTERGILSEGSSSHDTKPRSNSAPSLPSITCRCAITGCRVRRRKFSRGSSSMSLPVTREELERNSFGYEKPAFYSTELVTLCEDEHDVLHEVKRPSLDHRHTTNCTTDWGTSSINTGPARIGTSSGSGKMEHMLFKVDKRKGIH